MSGIRRWRAVALLAVGIAAGVVMTATPATGHVAGWAHNWTKHIRPKADKRYLPGQNLPRGATLRGTYSMGGTAAGASTLTTSEISFGWRLPVAPTPHFIEIDETPPPECPGTQAAPAAAPGHLCIYEYSAVNASGRGVNGPNADGSTYRFGTRLFVNSNSAGVFWSMGTWAVTSGPAPPVAAAPASPTTQLGVVVE